MGAAGLIHLLAVEDCLQKLGRRPVDGVPDAGEPARIDEVSDGAVVVAEEAGRDDEELIVRLRIAEQGGHVDGADLGVR